MTTIGSDTQRAVPARRRRALAGAGLVAPAISTSSVAVAAIVAALLFGTSPVVVWIGLALVAVTALITARRTFANLAAGLSLLLIKPYRPGERVRLFAPQQRAVVEGEIVHIGPLTTVLATSRGHVVMPNNRMLRAAPECRQT